MRTHCRAIIFLEPEPFPTLTPFDPSASLATEEGGELALSVGVTEYVIPFEVTKLNSDYDFIESDISNTEDLNPLVIGFTLTERTADGFKLQLDSTPDTVHFVYRWKVRVTAI